MSETVVSRTFDVSNVTKATEPLVEVPYHRAVVSFLDGPVESCSRYHGSLVAKVYSHPLIAALHAAFTTHRPIILTPDIIWLTMTQGLAIHINQNAESLRRHFVSHEGTLKIQVRRDDFIKGSPENPWPDVFSEFSEQIRNHIGDAHDLIVANFSTTSRVERAAYQLVLLDSMQSYFDYEVHTACGIPSISLEGTADDWRAIALRTEELSQFDLEWWVEPLLPVLHQFAAAAEGTVDRSFWDSIYKFHGSEGSGSPHVSGWVSRLFPYLRGWSDAHHCTLLRNVAPSWPSYPTRESFPKTTSKTPFEWKVGVPPNLITYDMEFVGGLMGVSQDPESLALRPEIGWAVRDVRASKVGANRQWEPWNPDEVL